MAQVSILMPIFNADRYLDITLNSIERQSFEDFEVLLVDDGSTDDSYAICKRWCSKDSRFKCRHQENAGGGVARNVALDWALESDSEYIAWVDSDDLVSPRYLEVLIGAAKRYSCDIVQCRFFSFNDGNECAIDFKPNYSENRICVSSGLEFEKRLLIGGIDSAVLWNKLWKKSIYTDIRVSIRDGLSGRINDDENILWKLYLHTDRVIDLPACLYGYRIRTDSVQHSKTNRRVLETFEIWGDRWRYYRSNSYHDLSRIASEKILHVFALLLSKSIDEYEDWSSFSEESKKCYLNCRYMTCDARRPDLLVLRFITKYWFGFFRIYGLLYRALRSSN